MPKALTLFCLSLAACEGGGNWPGQALVDEAKAAVQAATGLADRGGQALGNLGLMPRYTCGEPRASFVSAAVDNLELAHACFIVTTSSPDANRDMVSISFPTEGCEADALLLTGRVTFTYEGGESRMDLTADLRELAIDGQPLELEAGYSTCGDQKTVWVRGTGSLAGSLAFGIDASLALQAGLPIFGSDTLVLNGTATLTREAGQDTVAFEQLALKPGDLLPKSGSLTVATATGHTIRARFSEGSLLDEVELKIDDFDPITLPLI